MKKKILITAALPYANGPLHFGHIAGAYLPADCYARFQRLQKQDVLYICGSDEYGIAITLSADLAKRLPQEHVNIFHEMNKSFFKTLDMSFDHYSRTTCKEHIAPVQQFFKDLLANGYIEEKESEQLYSELDQKFLADRYVVGICPKCGYDKARGDECPSCGASFDAIDLKNPRSKLSNAPLTRRVTKHWFILLEKFQDKLKNWLKDKDWKPNVKNFVKGYIDDLHARAITRDSNWGVKIPLENTSEKVFYVWFDAPIGYISATIEWAKEKNDNEAWKKYWLSPDTKLVQFIGKDNIPFHAVIFPAMVMGQNLPIKLVDELVANEFLNLEGRQFSKSDGWTIDLEDFFTKYTTDQIRYFLAAQAPETADSEFTWKDFQLRCNTDLVGKFGNLVNRVLVFAKNNGITKVPEKKDLEPIDQDFLQTVQKIVKEALESYETFKLKKASQLIMELAQNGNVYFDAKKPWKDAKEPSKRSQLENTIFCCLECLKGLALIAYPIIPSTAIKIWEFLGFTISLEEMGSDQIQKTSIPVGQTLKEPKILFSKIEDEAIDAEIFKLQSNLKLAATKSCITKPEISYEEFSKLDLRVATILKAEPVPKSKKLICLQVDIGDQKKQIVAGIGEHVKPVDLIGKSIVVVANLKATKLMGVESQGMLLAGHHNKILQLVSIENLPPGSIVK